jgi:hypothetical protein
MASTPLTGWNIWVDADGRCRQFSVTESDRAVADELVLARAPGGKIVFAYEIPNSVIAFLKANRGQVMEWFAADKNHPIGAPNVRAEKMRG